jgi:predicted P-loop ATPase
MMILESEQGLQKSTALSLLCPDREWFLDDFPLDVDAKELIERTSGKWIIEASELQGMRASQMESIKALLSRSVDGPVRPAYGRISVEKERQFIVIGTTNGHSYLSDFTGNRRFLPIRIEKFDLDWIRKWRDQLWAEAVSREAAGESIRLPEELYEYAGIQQERRRSEDPWEEKIGIAFKEEYQRLAPSEVWEALGVPTERRDDRGQRRINQTMQRLGFRRMTVKDRDGNIVKGWARGVGQRDKSLPFDGE